MSLLDLQQVPALLQEPSNGKQRCLTCERRCLLAEGQRGWCGTRLNRGGSICTLTYGAVSSLSANPIEKKPLYHFYPGSRALTAGSWSCNFGCPWCQNADISKLAPPQPGLAMTPEDFVQETIALGCQGTSISFNEPTLSLEWSLQVFVRARDKGLYNTFVTNGYMTAGALQLLAEAGLGAMNVDLKGSRAQVRQHCGAADVELVWARCNQAKQLRLHLEMTTLIIPGVNDDEETLQAIASRIAEELGPETPWHISRYHPADRFTAPPTPLAKLERVHALGRLTGLKHVYIGNIPGHPSQHTYCPRCGTRVIARSGFALMQNMLIEGRCPACENPLAGLGWHWRET